MFKNFIKKKTKKIEEIISPLTGTLVQLSDVPDPIFSNKMIGDGVAIQPLLEKMNLLAPIDGEIIMVSETKHAIGIKSKDGIELLIHIGLDTVELKGEGFHTFVNVGDHVKTGDKLIEVDFHFIHLQGKNIITPVIISQNEQNKFELTVNNHENVHAGEDFLFSIERVN